MYTHPLIMISNVCKFIQMFHKSECIVGIIATDGGHSPLV